MTVALVETKHDDSNTHLITIGAYKTINNFRLRYKIMCLSQKGEI